MKVASTSCILKLINPKKVLSTIQQIFRSGSISNLNQKAKDNLMFGLMLSRCYCCLCHYSTRVAQMRDTTYG